MAVDARFYKQKTSLTVGQIAKRLETDASDSAERPIAGISSLEHAGPTDLCFMEDAKHIALAKASGFGLCLMTPALQAQADWTDSVLATVTPRRSFFEIAQDLFEPIEALVAAPPAAIHETASVGSGAVIVSGAAIGAGTIIGPGAVIGAGVQIGANCTIGANASITCALIGNNVRIFAGARIGEAGFGLMPGDTGALDIPHFGRVILQDNVSLGANTCVDRGLLDDTVIGEGTKIDNMSHIGHNTQVGRHVVMAAYAGISGSVTIGDGVRMGGRVGILDHVKVGAGASLGAGTIVSKDIPPGEMWAGLPSRPMKTWQRETIWLKKNAKRKPRK